MAPPQGLIIRGEGASRKRQWKVGKRIGEGACASVHTLLESNNSSGNNGKETEYVVKIVPLPTKVTKKKMTLPERNARLLHFEELVYKNQFPEFQGYVLPKLSPYDGPPSYGETDGFRFLTMEKMKAPFWDVIPELLRSGSSQIGIGPIGEQLLTCVQVFHDKKHVLVDIKPENFMLAYNDHNQKKTKKKESVAEGLAGKLRVLDLGLVQNFKTAEGHRPDEGISEIVGTPLYSSLNLHSNHTPSRRDDVEAIGYVIAELIIRLVAAQNGQADNYEKRGCDIPSYLPWSQEKSDAAIGKVKEKQVNDIKSQFYKRMGDDKATAKTMMAFFEAAQDIKYKAEPDYEKFRELLSTLVVSVGPPQKKKAASKSQKSAQSTTRRSKRAAAAVEIDDSEDEEADCDVGESPSKRNKKGNEEFVDAAMELDDNDADDEDTYATAQEMDWEPEPTMKENLAAKTSDGIVGVSLVVTEGPHAGEHFDLTTGASVMIGREPASSQANKALALWELPNDEEVSGTHLRLELHVTRQRCTVKIVDLQSTNGTRVRKEQLKKGGSIQAFINDSFTIGQSTFCIRVLSNKEKTAKPKAAAKQKAPLANQNQDAVMVVVKGPHKGESFGFIRGDTDAYNFGSARSVAKGGLPAILDSDESIEKRHLRAQLQNSKKVLKILLTDISESSSGVLLNGKKIAKNKEVAAFVNDRVTIGETELVVRRE
ncbi:kinase I isoform alpha [Seminavis robusta]|uniref:Casein kinase I n=1 Tax=Seminavis robusta TaxID=568900 RepID=A0A9N8D9C5_9STRA|nr:kinase I isoform alpha [Seminavis robusta]|eukprot:Sro22_g015390.1 kinase I isoform alpha (710) ;mRNA; f:102713-105057